MKFEQKCRELGGEIDYRFVTRHIETPVCVIKNPKAYNFIDVVSRPMNKIGIAIFTSAPKPSETDFAVYKEPSLATELIRIRYKPEERIPVTVEITKEGMEKLELSD